MELVLSKDPSRVPNGADESLPYPERPLDAYTSTKMEAEKLVRSANGTNGLLTCIMRPASVDHMLFRQSLSAQSFSIGEGSPKISLVPLAAATRARLLAEKKLMEEGAESVVAGKAYNLCVEDKIALCDFLGLGANEKGTTVWGYPPPKSIPMWIVVLGAYLNRYVYILTGTVLFGDIFSPMNLSFYDVDQTFTSASGSQGAGVGGVASMAGDCEGTREGVQRRYREEGEVILAYYVHVWLSKIMYITTYMYVTLSLSTSGKLRMRSAEVIFCGSVS